MTDGRPDSPPDEVAPVRTAGSLLRAAREREGLHLAVLAATIKVSPAKLDALEKDRYDELPNPTFARALAQSVCRSLKIDPRPVLALLPQQDTPPLEAAVGKLNTPFQERSSHRDGAGLTWASKPMFWAGGLLLVAAVAVAVIPRHWLEGLQQVAVPLPASSVTPGVVAAPPGAASAPALAGAATPGSDGVAAAGASQAAPAAAEALATAVGLPSAASAAASAADLVRSAVAAVVPMPVPSAPAAIPAPAPVASAAAPAGAVAAPLALSVRQPSWIEVVDVDGRSLLSRVLQPGEVVGVDGRRPLRLTVGNAMGTQVTFQGAVVDLAPHTRDNVARLQLR